MPSINTKAAIFLKVTISLKNITDKTKERIVPIFIRIINLEISVYFLAFVSKNANTPKLRAQKE